jgi:hypothetical protein
MLIIDKRVREFADEKGWTERGRTELAEYVEGVVTGFIGALLWTSRCNGQATECDHYGRTGEEVQDCDRGLDNLFNESDLAGKAYDEIRIDVADFVCSNLADTMAAGLTAGDVGYDFVLTRNREGAGFWDRGLGDRGQRLTDASHAYGEMSAYVGDDGLLYV